MKRPIFRLPLLHFPQWPNKTWVPLPLPVKASDAGPICVGNGQRVCRHHAASETLRLCIGCLWASNSAQKARATAAKLIAPVVALAHLCPYLGYQNRAGLPCDWWQLVTRTGSRCWNLRYRRNNRTRSRCWVVRNWIVRSCWRKGGVTWVSIIWWPISLRTSRHSRRIVGNRRRRRVRLSVSRRGRGCE